MATASLPPSATRNIDRTTVGRALRIMRREYAQNRTALNALNKAELELGLGVWQFDGHTLVIESRNTIGHKYTVTASGCDASCRACGPHWHRAAYELLRRAASMAPQPVKPRMSDAQYAATCAAADELYS